MEERAGRKRKCWREREKGGRGGIEAAEVTVREALVSNAE